tara:strand:- start:3121 stop:4581 length:1461 start_codon:yes stop_codon:yes gene_type:complete
MAATALFQAYGAYNTGSLPGETLDIYTKPVIDDDTEIDFIEYDKSGLAVKKHMIKKMPLPNANHDWKSVTNANQRKSFLSKFGYDPSNDPKGTTNKESTPEPPMRDIDPIVAQMKTRQRLKKDAVLLSVDKTTRETMTGMTDQGSILNKGHDMRSLQARLPAGSNLVPTHTRRSLIETPRQPNAKTAQHSLELPSQMGIVTNKVRPTKLAETKTRSQLPSQEDAESVHLGEWNEKHLNSKRGNKASSSIKRKEVLVAATISRDQGLDTLNYKVYDISFLPTMDSSGAQPIEGGPFDVRNSTHTLVDFRRDDLPTVDVANRREGQVSDGLQLRVGDSRHLPNRADYSDVGSTFRKESILEMQNINGNIYDHTPKKITYDTCADADRVQGAFIFDTVTGVGDLGATDRTYPHLDGPATIERRSERINERLFDYDGRLLPHGTKIVQTTPNIGVQTKRHKPRLGSNLTRPFHTTTHYIRGPDDRDTSSF